MELFNEIVKNNPGIDITEAFNEAFLLADDFLIQEKMNSGCTAVASFIRWEPETDEGKTRQLWDVCSDQDAVNLIKDIEDPQEASKKL
ncbi:mgpp2cl-1, protein phosphatase 2C-like protein 1, partial [Massospora cicadina]